MKFTSRTKKFLLVLLVLVLSLALGASLGILLAKKCGDSLSALQAGGYMIGSILLLSLAFVVQIILHEVGHMIAALLRGWKFIYFMIFSFIFTKQNGKFEVSRLKIPGALGQCIMSPPESGDTDGGILFYNAGGLIMNLLISIIALVVVIAGFDALSFVAAIFCYSLVITGLFIFLTNGIPSKASGLPNDGMNMLNLHKDPFSTKIFLESIRVVGQLFKGNRIQEVYKSYICDGQIIDYANPIHVMGASFDLSAAMAKLDFEKAKVILNSAEPYSGQIIALYRKEMTFEKIYLRLIEPHEQHDIAFLLTKEMKDYIEQQAKFRPVAIRVQYALARLYEKDEEKAEKIYLHFLQFCDNYYIKGEAKIEKDLVEYVRQFKTEPAITE